MISNCFLCEYSFPSILGVYWCEFIVSHRSHCVRADQYSDQTLSVSINLLLVLLKRLNGVPSIQPCSYIIWTFSPNESNNWSNNWATLFVSIATQRLLKGTLKFLTLIQEIHMAIPHPFGKCVQIYVENINNLLLYFKILYCERM